MVWLVQLHRIQLWVAMPVNSDDPEVPADASKPSCTKACVQLKPFSQSDLLTLIHAGKLAALARQPSLKPEAVQPSDRKPEAAAIEPEELEVKASKKQHKRAKLGEGEGKPNDHKEGFMATDTQSPSRSTTTMKRPAVASSSQRAK